MPIALGTVAFIVIGSASAGSALAPGPLAPVGVVAATVDTLAGTGSQAAGSGDGRGGVANPPERGEGRPPILRDAPPVAGLVGYRWPLPRGRITLPFGPTPWGSRIVGGVPFHDGVDMATFCGDRIVAAHDGMVLAAGRHYDDVVGWLGDLTPYYERLDARKLWSTLPIIVVIDDGNGYRSVYAHFGKVVVKQGQSVLAGSLLGYEGRTGRASGCHLHYGLFSPFEWGEFAIDPAVVKRMKVPPAEVARVDPLVVLPPRPTPTASPNPTPGPNATPGPNVTSTP